MKPPYVRPHVMPCRDYAPLRSRRRRSWDDAREFHWRDLVENFAVVLLIGIGLWLALVWGAAMGFGG